jgi:glycerophosphoryl diester phosphodiesterase
MAGVGPRYPSLAQPPLGFARTGASAESAADLLAAFAGALALGSPGLAAEAWLTADRRVVLHDGPAVRRGLRRRPLAEMTRSEVPRHIPDLGELYDRCGTGFELALAVGDEATAEAVVAAAGDAGAGAVGRLWLCPPDWRQAASWRELSDEAHLVDVTRMRRITEGPERRAAALAAAGIDAISLPESDWSAGLTTLFHRFERLTFAGAVQHRRQMDALLAMGIDAVSSDRVERMVEALAALPTPR